MKKVQMTFFTETNNVRFPSIQLTKDNWDDYHHKVSFNVYLHSAQTNYLHLGTIKILDDSTKETVLPKQFDKLPPNYCSLGQSMEYYENIKKYCPSNFEEVLEALNDVAFDDDIAKTFEGIEGFQTALLRFGSAEIAFKEAKNLLLYDLRTITDDIEFSYEVQLEGASDKHKVNFNFNKTEHLPYRINVLIGKNGTGKTSYLGGMVKSISGVKNKQGFLPHYPLFSKVIAISYSLFDDFPKPPNSTVFNYRYIGLRAGEEDIVSDEKLGQKLRAALFAIIDDNRDDQWYEIINEIIPLKDLGLSTANDLNKEWVSSISYEKAKRLSSGQSILLFILTELIATIQDKTLILFDEPETHLHPSAIAQLMNGFYNILSMYESYAIISTHSPIIIQDVPSKYISVFERHGNLPIIKRLAMESFGENISEITSIAFGTVDVKELYKIYLEKMVNEGFDSLEAINYFFDDKLSFNAQLYLAALVQINRNEKS
ncbi:hypothetical protein A0256_20720 [Mucilaginibacter sp. PAMC 26640]|nr:hypothetical protein A0256_20720 [Mucilaginibacter sp. PAMC 26640]